MLAGSGVSDALTGEAGFSLSLLGEWYGGGEDGILASSVLALLSFCSRSEEGSWRLK